MQQNSLIQILKTFSKEEIREFNLFVNSPFFNKNKNVIKLFRLLEKQYPEFNSNSIKKETLFKEIFSGELYCDENIKTIIYLLSRLAEKFISYQKFQSDKFDERNKLMISLDKRKLDKLFVKYENKTLTEFEMIKTTDLGLIENRISFEKTKAAFYSERNDEEKMYRTEIKTSGLMTASFMIEMFKLTNLFARIKYLGFDLGFDFATEFMRSIDLGNFIETLRNHLPEQLPIVEVYFHLHNSLNDTESDEHFAKFKKSFLKNRESLGKSEQYIISTLMVNCLYYKHLKDRAKYDRELFEAFKILISLYDYSGDKHLRSVVFANVLRLAVQFREFDWTENYIKEYSVRLKPENRENMYFYSNAYLSFAKGEFEKTLEFSSKINFETFQMKYYLRDLQLSAYYELSMFDPALDMIDAYKHFIKTEKNYSDKLKQGYIEFIKCLRQLIKIRLGEGKIEIESLKQKIAGANSMRKQWLLEKTEELGK